MHRCVPQATAAPRGTARRNAGPDGTHVGGRPATQQTLATTRSFTAGQGTHAGVAAVSGRLSVTRAQALAPLEAKPVLTASALQPLPRTRLNHYVPTGASIRP